MNDTKQCFLDLESFNRFHADYDNIGVNSHENCFRLDVYRDYYKRFKYGMYSNKKITYILGEIDGLWVYTEIDKTSCRLKPLVLKKDSLDILLLHEYPIIYCRYSPTLAFINI